MSSNIISTQTNIQGILQDKSNVGGPQSKLLDKNAKSERIALKEINPNVNRIQPFRAAKQNSTKEGFFCAQSSSTGSKPDGSTSGFTIFNDNSKEDEASKKEESDRLSASVKTQLHPALTTLSLSRVPFGNLHKHETPSSTHESPMMLDVSEEERLNIFDIDNEEGPFGFSEYAVEIFEHLREAERLHRPKATYMSKQQDITTGMRSILVDWLIEVGEEYRLHNETSHLAINYIDRFLSQMAVLRGKLQLVGTAAMFLAAKFEEIYPPDLGEFVYITDDTYSKKQVLRMEHLILKVLNFDIAVPTSNQFLKRFLKAAKADAKTEHLSQYLCELALVEYDCIQYLPSTLAAAAVCLASFTVSGKIWDDSMEFYMKYTFEELQPCIKRLYDVMKAVKEQAHQAIPEKYKDAKYDCVSTLEAPENLPFEIAESETAG